MVIEHPHIGDCYDNAGGWSIMDAQFQFVAVACWGEHRRIENNVNRGQSWHLTKIIRAESHSIEELQEWAQVQQSNGVEWVSFFETWVIKDGKLAGKRDNRRLTLSTQG